MKRVAEVIAVDQGAVARIPPLCTHCQCRCGGGGEIPVPVDLVGGDVMVSANPGVLTRLLLLVLVLPVAGLVGGAALADWLGMAEGSSILCATGGFVVALLVGAKFASGDPADEAPFHIEKLDDCTHLQS